MARTNGMRRGGFKTKAGGYQRAKRSWVCDVCDAQYEKKQYFCGVCGNTSYFLFQSQKESNRYFQLRVLEKARAISDLEVHPSFEFDSINTSGNRVVLFTYVADFKYIENGKLIVEDVKPSLDKKSFDPMFNLKQRCMRLKYLINLRITA